MLAGLSLFSLTMLLAIGLLLDTLLGEVKRWHPLVGFGKLATCVENWFNRGRIKRISGVCACIIAIIPIVIISQCLIRHSNIYYQSLIHIALLYFCVGLRSLYDHTQPIQLALLDGNLTQARQLTACIVSRDTQQASTDELSKAAVESLLENGNDAVFGTIFWFVVAGGSGALLFRLANTLDAMWGYRNARFNDFGYVAAKIDDVLNYLPARLTAISYAILGNTKLALSCWRTQAPSWSSPNAGPVMAAGAGALAIELGGAASYDGVVEDRPKLGSGRYAQPNDIHRAWRLVVLVTMLWWGMLFFVSLLSEIFH